MGTKSTAGGRGGAKALVAIDAFVEWQEVLLGGLPAHAEILKLDAFGDGVAEIAEALAGRDDIASLHIVAHGRSGAVDLGLATLGFDTIAEHGEALAAWADALAGRDILLYGCRVAEGAAGRAFLEGLRAATGANIAASARVVGRHEGEPNWRLETRLGEVSAPVVFPAGVQAAYPGHLATVSFGIEPPFSIESTASATTFTFTLDAAPAPGEFVGVWFFASDTADAPVAEARTNEISQFSVFDLFDPANVVGIPIVAETNGVPAYDADASVVAGASVVPDFTVLELRLTALVNTITLTGFDDGVDDGPREVFWRVVDAPGGVDATIVNGAVAFTEADDPSEAPAAVVVVPGTDEDDSFVFGDLAVPRRVEGGAGEDSATLPAAFADLAIEPVAGGFRVVPAEGEAVELLSVETIVLDDATLAVSRDPETVTLALVYDVAFDRLGDVPGLSFWDGVRAGGLSLDDIADFFAASGEFEALYGAGLDEGAFFDVLYDNAFGRAADGEGRAFWVAALEAGEIDRGDAIMLFARSGEIAEVNANAIDDGVLLFA